MAKFLINASYSSSGVQGILKQGASARKAVVDKAVGALGGTVEAFYFTFGEKDIVVICDVPDNATAAALSMAVNATGSVHLSMTPLLTLADMDAACKKTVNYTAPGA